MIPTHIDLFTGIGGFTLAAHANGCETVVMCEFDKRRRTFLEKAWPGIPIHDDVRTFDGTKWTGAALLTGGVPCQPASRAGKQRGKEDDRWLWPEALRIVAEAQPRWCLFENPPGIRDVGLDGILSDLEALGYEIGLADIPACAVNSPHLRHRYWIVAHRDEAGCGQQRRAEPVQAKHVAVECCGQSHLANTKDIPIKSICGNGRDIRAEGQEGWGAEFGEGFGQGHLADNQTAGRIRTKQLEDHCGCKRGWKVTDDIEPKTEIRDGHLADTGTECGQTRRPEPEGQQWKVEIAESSGYWRNCVWLPCADGKLRRAPGDAFGVVDGLHRSLLAALGDSIVPQVAAEFIRAIKGVLW